MRLYVLAAFAASLSMLSSPSLAGCKSCNSGHAPIASPLVEVVPVPVPVPMPPRQPPAIGQVIAPPPGTLGRTYQVKSRPVSIDEHPRLSKLEILGASHLDLVISGVEKFEGERGPDGIWRFESDKPLVPGMPHIYRVHAVQRDGYNRRVPVDTRTVRLIPGRVMQITY